MFHVYQAVQAVLRSHLSLAILRAVYPFSGPPSIPSSTCSPLIQESLLQDLDDTRSLVLLLLGDSLHLGLFQLGLQLHLLLDPLGLLGGVGSGRVDQGSDGRREFGRCDPQRFGQSVDLGLDIGVARDDFALAGNGGFTGGLGLLLRKSPREGTASVSIIQQNQCGHRSAVDLR